MKKIVLISTGQPSTNPRLVKEADALHAVGHDVTVLYSSFIPWADKTDIGLFASRKWKYKLVGGNSYQSKRTYLFTRIRYKLAGIINRYSSVWFLIAERSQARAYDELLREAKKIKADWYIGHNLGALAVAVNAAYFNKSQAGFDFEDYHRGEANSEEITRLKRIVYLENKYVPLLSYFSTASEMITAVTKENHPSFKGNIITLNNCFSLQQQPAFCEKAAGDDTLQLFWFSQTIGLKRGLEVLLEALQILNDPSIHLTLAGRCDERFTQYIREHAKHILSNIHFAGIIPPNNLPYFSSKFDAGLALETGFSENNNIALSNKIFTYLLAGNAILLSATEMQTAFHNKYFTGELYPIDDAQALAEKIELYKNKEKLNADKQYNYRLADKQMNWEMESEKLLSIIT